MPFFFFYLDDGLVAGETLSISQGLQAIQQVARLVGPHFKFGKCELVAVGPTLSPILLHSCPRVCMVSTEVGPVAKIADT